MKEFESIPWKIKDVGKVFVLSFILGFSAFMILSFFNVFEHVKTSVEIPVLQSFYMFLLYLLQIVLLLGPFWFFAIRNKKVTLKTLSFNWIGTWKTILWVVFSYIFYIGLGIFLLILFSYFNIQNFGFEDQTSLFDIFGENALGVVISFIVAVVIAPIVEEIFFRGFVLRTLYKHIGATWAVIITTLIFASLHFEFQAIIPLLILSFVLNILFVRTKSIWPGIVFHIFNNTVAFIFLYLLPIFFV